MEARRRKTDGRAEVAGEEGVAAGGVEGAEGVKKEGMGMGVARQV